MTNVYERVAEHGKYVDKIITSHVRLFTALAGSQNYSLNDELSDVDTKSLMIPTFESLVFAKNRLSHTLKIYPTLEQSDVKDAREMFTCFLKQNINFLEILFTPYIDVVSNYYSFYCRLKGIREDIAHYNPNRALHCMCGMAYDKYKAFNHPYPSAKEQLDKYGYSPKQLMHMLRLKDFMYRYIEGETYQRCLMPRNRRYLLDVKRGCLSYEEALQVRENTKNWVDQFYAKHKTLVPNRANKQVAEALNDITYDLFVMCYNTNNMY